VVPDDRAPFYDVFRYDRDTTGEGHQRIVELTPVDSLPPGCEGQWAVVPFDPARPLEVWRYAIHTYPAFTVTRVMPTRTCWNDSDTTCHVEQLQVQLSAPIRLNQVREAIRTTPALPLDASMRTGQAATQQIQFSERLTPRARYSVAVDTSLRDIFGRSLQGPTTFTLVAPDRTPGIKQQSGLVSIAPDRRGNASILIRTLNVDTALMIAIPIPDSLTALVLSASRDRRYELRQRLRAAMPDTVRMVIPVHGEFNTESNTTVVLPPLLTRPGAPPLIAVRFEVHASSIAPDSLHTTTTRRIQETRVRQLNEQFKTAEQFDFGLIVQVTPWVAHSKMSNNRGAVFLTDRAGTPVTRANVELHSGHGHVLSRGTSNRDGLVLLEPWRTARPDTRRSEIARDPVLDGLRYLVVTRDNNRLVTPLTGQIPTTLQAQLDPYALGALSGQSKFVRGTITADRDLYRPGEMVYSKLVVRSGLVGRTRTPVGDSARVTLLRGYVNDYRDRFMPFRDTEQDTIGVWTTLLNQFGTASDSIHIPDTEPLGTLTLVADAFVDSAWQRIALTALRLEEFRPPEFLVTFKSDTAFRFVGDTVVTALDATYLYGAPMSGATVTWSAYSSPTSGTGRTIPNTRGFAIGRSFWWEENERPETMYLNGTARLNRGGHVDLHIPTTAGALSRPSVLNISVAVHDITGKAVTTNGYAYLQPSALFIALKDQNTSWYWKPGNAQTIDAMVVRPTGERVAGVQMHVTLIRRRFELDTTPQNMYNQYRWIADTVRRWTVSSADTLVPITFTPNAEGLYDVRVEAVDIQDRATVTNVGKPAYSQAWLADYGRNPLQLKVGTQHTANERFALGDTANVSFESPFARANAWITVEREGIVEQRRIPVTRGPITVPVPVTDRLAPNVWVGVTLVNVSDTLVHGASAVAPLLRAGYVQLRVDSTAHRLHVRVLPTPSEVRPGGIATVKVRIGEARLGGTRRLAPVEVALWAVDEGVLSMTGFRTPDILNAIDAQLGVAQTLRTSLAQLPWVQPSGSVKPGVNVADIRSGLRLSAMAVAGGMATVERAKSPYSVAELSSGAQPVSIKIRSDFRLTAFFVGSAITDENGDVEIRAQLPDNITSFRLMATAVGNNNRYGSGDATLLVSQRMVVRPALPRFLRPGDSLVAAAAVNLRRDAGIVRVTAATTGGLSGSLSPQFIFVTGDSGAVAQFAMTIPAQDTSTVSSITFTAEDTVRGDGDAITTIVPIKPVGTVRAHTVIGTVRDSGVATFTLPADIDPAKSQLTLSLGTSPLVAMRSHYDRLRAYTYYSTDAVVARARALLTMSRVEVLLGEPVVMRDSIAMTTDLQAAVATLLNRQRQDGDFAYFAGSNSSAGSFVTAYAGALLLDAQRAGVAVPETALTGVSDHLEEVLHDGTWKPDTVTGSPANRRYALQRYLGARVVIVQYLRHAGRPQVSVEDSLVSMANHMAWEDRVSLLDVMAARSDLAGQARALLDNMWTGVAVAGRRIEFADSLFGAGPFPSHIRPPSRLLTVTKKLRPDHPLLGALSESILQQSAAEQRWAWNVHDHAFAIEALAEMAQAQRGTGAAHVVVRSTTGGTIFTRSTAGAAHSDLAGDSSSVSLNTLLHTNTDGSTQLALTLHVETANSSAGVVPNTPVYYSLTVNEVPRHRPITPDMAGIVVERWYESLENGAPTIEAIEGSLVRVRLRVTVPNDRQFVAMEDMLPAGLEAVDVSYRTSSQLSPFAPTITQPYATRPRTGPFWQGALYGSWDGVWWSPWEEKEIRDDRVFYFTRQLWAGTYETAYVARATTVGNFVRPPAHAEEMYNAAVQGRSDGGVFRVLPRR
jgi:uncharacterized protein YfaS (alpha-2-macroglobulin family)